MFNFTKETRPGCASYDKSLYTRIINSIVYFWETSSLLIKILCLLLVVIITVGFLFNFHTGVWILNPFVAATWKGSFLKIRLIWAAFGFVTSIIAQLLGYQIADEFNL